jgi:hypothetical protein
MNRRLAIPALFLALACLWPVAAEESAGQVHVLLVGGLPGSPVYARRYQDWIKRFHAYFTGALKVPAANIIVISGDKDFKDPIVKGLANAESIQKELIAMAGKVKPADQFVLLLLGHGGVTDPIPTLVVPGPDINAPQILEGLDRITAQNQVILNFSAAGGAMVKPLKKKDRVQVTAVRDMEANEPVYTEFFLRGLESGEADGAEAPDAGKKDGTITLLEAYHWAARQTALWIARQSKTPDGDTWKLDGKQSIEIFEKLTKAEAGQFGARQLDPQSNRAVPDVEVPLVPPPDQMPEDWTGKRIITEHAALEDCGAEIPVAALQSEGFKPLTGKAAGEPGALARRVVLGKAALLKAEGP